MTAPRNCRACGTPLPPSVRWCHLCYTKVVELTPRPTDGGGYVGELRPEVRYSRWRGSAFTFGPAGRIAITLGVLLFGASFVAQGFNPAMIWPLGMYAIVAVLILRETWKPVRVDDPAPEAATVTERRRRHPVLFRPLPPRLLIVLSGGAALVVAYLAVRHKSALALFLPACALVMAAFGYLITRLSGL
jgi:hypothetical protein